MKPTNPYFGSTTLSAFPLHCVLLWGAAIAIPCLVAQQGLAQSRTDVIAQSGQAAPDGNGVFDQFSRAKMNDAGEVAFGSTLTGTSGGATDNEGIFRSSSGFVSQVARTGTLAPDGDGSLSGFLDSHQINNAGQVAFVATFTGTAGGDGFSRVLRESGGSIDQIVRLGQSAPDFNGVYSVLLGPQIDDTGRVGFRGSLTGTSAGFPFDTSGFFFWDGGPVQQMMRSGQSAPDGDGEIFSSPYQVMNNSGQIAFAAPLNGASGGVANDSGIFRNGIASSVQIVREGQLAPDGNGTFGDLADAPVPRIDINDLGHVAFDARLEGVSGGATEGIFVARNGGLIQVVREGQAAPDGNGTFDLNSSPVHINNAADVAFGARLAGTTGTTGAIEGIFRGNGGGITRLAGGGDAAPDGNGRLLTPTIQGFNDAGQVTYFSELVDTKGGTNDDSGIFTSDGIDNLTVIREGDSLAGSQVISISPNSIQLNELGQVAYQAFLANGDTTINRWTPDLHWRNRFDSSWDSGVNWTLSLNPGDPHNVFIDPKGSVTVLGPANDTNVRFLQIGGNTGQATLDLQQGAVLTSSFGVNLENRGVLTGDGVINSDVFVKSGASIVADNLTVTGGSIINSGLIHGNGYIGGGVFNDVAGEIHANDGDTLQFGDLDQAGGLNNAGRMEVIGGELRVFGDINNLSSTGFVTGRNATMRWDNLNNDGSLGFSFGTSDVFGDVMNNADGTISVTGGANVTFYEDVTQNGTLQVVTTGSVESNAVFFGELSGTGGMVGGGNLFALGDLRPGASPASVLFDGNVYLGASTDTFIELGGLGLGEYDQMVVTGELGLAGDLSVSLIDGHTLGHNQFYLIGDVGSLFGEFQGLAEGDLVGTFGGHELFITYSGGNGNDVGLFTAVPEPGSVFVLAIGGVFIVNRRRRS